MAQFDPSKAHAVELSIGNRRVVVASPRLIDQLPPGDLHRRKELGFSIPADMSGAQTVNQALIFENVGPTVLGLLERGF